MGHTHTKKLFVVDVKFKFNCIASMFSCKVWEPCFHCVFISEEPNNRFPGDHYLYFIITDSHLTALSNHTNLHWGALEHKYKKKTPLSALWRLGKHFHCTTTKTGNFALCIRFFK